MDGTHANLLTAPFSAGMHEYSPDEYNELQTDRYFAFTHELGCHTCQLLSRVVSRVPGLLLKQFLEGFCSLPGLSGVFSMVKAFCRIFCLLILLVQEQAVSRLRHCKLRLFPAAVQTLQLQTLGPSSQTCTCWGELDYVEQNFLLPKIRRPSGIKWSTRTKNHPGFGSLAILYSQRMQEGATTPAGPSSKYFCTAAKTSCEQPRQGGWP